MEDSLLLDIAKDAIKEEFEEDSLIDTTSLIKKYPQLSEDAATFVTLNLNGKLRGCIGSLVAHRSLIEDIKHNAKAAAFSDLRFDRLTKEEFENIDIELSILTKPEILKYSNFDDLEKKLIPNKHGVILELDGKRATFLPQVWEQLPDFDSFMTHLVHKAGLDPSKLSSYPKIEVYEALKIK